MNSEFSAGTDGFNDSGGVGFLVVMDGSLNDSGVQN